jgi:hypothetical protein
MASLTITYPSTSNCLPYCFTVITIPTTSHTYQKHNLNPLHHGN